MFSRNRDDTTRAEPRGGIIPSVHSVLAVRLPGSARQDFFKGTSSQPIGRRRGINKSGVDFWHAVEFSRNGRFLCTHPLGLSSGLFPSVLRFRLYQIVFRSDFLGAFQVPASAFPFPAVPTLSEILSRISRPDRGLVPAHEAAGFPFRRSRKRTGAGRPDANRGAPLQVHAYEGSYAGQTSTTTGRIIGLRR